MKKIAITGGIGAGKSVISDYLKKQGHEVHDSDSVVSNLYKKPRKSFLDLLHGCGLKNIIINKKINKKLIAKHIFINKKLKAKLEKYIHNEVKLNRDSFVKNCKKLKKKFVFFDIPLLLENKLEKEFDLVLSIISTKKNRTKRVMKSKKFSKKILNNIYKNQTSDKQRRNKSDIIINNNKTKKEFIFAAEKVLTSILK